MNYVVLEGISLYLVLFMITLLLLISIGCIVCLILSDRREFVLKELLSREKQKVLCLTKQNFILRLRCGEFDIDEK